MIMMCPLGGLCDNLEMDKYSDAKSTGSGDDGSVLTVKLEKCRSINCPRLGENGKSDEKLEKNESKTEEYSSIKLKNSFNL